MRLLEQLIRRVLLRLIGTLRAREHPTPGNIPLESIHKILIVRQHDQLGDLLIATPAIRALRLRFPSAYIAVVVREYTAPVLLNNPYVDEVIVFYDKLWRWNLQRLISFWRALRVQGGFDCAIMLNTISRSFTSDLIAVMSKARYIIGPDHHSHDSGLPEQIYNVVVPRSPQQKHEIQRNLDIVRALGAKENDTRYDLVLTDSEVSEGEKIYQALGIRAGHALVGVHFGAENILKRFPLESLAKVIDWIAAEYDAEIVLIISPKEIERRTFLLSKLHSKVHSAPIMPLRVMAAFMRRIDLFICNDTGTLHIAASQNVPTVSFHSLSAPEIWKPPHSRHIALVAADGLITSITIDQVQSAVKSSLNKLEKKKYLR